CGGDVGLTGLLQIGAVVGGLLVDRLARRQRFRRDGRGTRSGLRGRIVPGQGRRRRVLPRRRCVRRPETLPGILRRWAGAAGPPVLPRPPSPCWGSGTKTDRSHEVSSWCSSSHATVKDPGGRAGARPLGPFIVEMPDRSLFPTDVPATFRGTRIFRVFE